jgi:predicted acyltransferase
MSSDLPATVPLPRLSSLDALRGLVMFLIAAEALEFAAVIEHLHAAGCPTAVWEFLLHHQKHVEWRGCVLHDMIQPTFSLLVGVVLPFSIAVRQAKGQSPWGMTLHAFWRALLLVFLGVFLRSLDSSQTNFTFEDTLSQIGLGYGLLFMLGFRPVRDQWIALGLILAGYWALFAFYPLPSETFDYAGVGVTAQWLHAHGLTGFAAHWQKNSNPAWAFDTWFLNLFPREKPFAYNGGGYATLSFIPTLGTMILGLIAGGVLRSERSPWVKVRWLVAAGAAMGACGWLLGWLGICPVVKRIWTPSWVLFAGGLSYLGIAAFYAVIEIGQWRGRATPLLVIGANSIAAYCMIQVFLEYRSYRFVHDALLRHVSPRFFAVLGTEFEPLVLGACQILVIWLILYWMYRRKLFLKI